MNYDGEIQQIRKRAEQQGWRYERLANNHHRFLSPDHVNIVQASSSSNDPSAIKFVLNDMRRAGYVHEDKASATTIALAMEAAQSKANGHSHGPERQIKGTVANVIRNCFREHPEAALTTQRVTDYVSARGIDTDAGRIGIMLARLVMQEEISRVERGTFRWGRGHRVVAPAPTVTPPAPSGINGAELTLTVVHKAAESTDQDPDELELDEALVALGRIEAVVRRYKGIIRQFAAMKKMLNSLDVK